MSNSPDYSLIVPIYKSRETLEALIAVVSDLNIALDNRLELVCVVDGSPDDSLEYLSAILPQQVFSSRLIVLSRNFGSFQAIRMGFAEANSKYYAVMAADLQEPPEFVQKAFYSLATEPIDVVIGVRQSRQDFSLTARVFWTMYRCLIQRDMPRGGMDIFACNQAFRDQLVAMEESNTSLVGQVLWLGFRRKSISYSRVARKAGVSAWSFSRKCRYLMDSVFSFTDLPVMGLFLIGYIGIGLSIVLTFLTLYAKFKGSIPIPGYTALVIMICFFAGLNSFGLGIIGTYVWRTYENTKARPLSVIANKVVYSGSKQ